MIIEEGYANQEIKCCVLLYGSTVSLSYLILLMIQTFLFFDSGKGRDWLPSEVFVALVYLSTYALVYLFLCHRILCKISTLQYMERLSVICWPVFLGLRSMVWILMSTHPKMIWNIGHCGDSFTQPRKKVFCLLQVSSLVISDSPVSIYVYVFLILNIYTTLTHLTLTHNTFN